MSQYETHLLIMDLNSAIREFNFVEINSIDELNKHYKFLAKKRHPDVGGSTSDFQRLTEAHTYLTKHIEIYKTTKVSKIYSHYKTQNNYKKDEQPSPYVCDPFLQTFSFKIKLLFLFCFISGIKVKTLNKITYVFLKNKTVIFTKKENTLKAYSTIINKRRVTFYNKNTKLDKNLFIRFI